MRSLRLFATIVTLSFGFNAVADVVSPQDAAKSCRELSLEISQLVILQNQTQGGYFSIPGTRLAASAAIVVEPAWFYLGYAAIRHLHESAAGSDLVARLRSLRAASADKLCYVR